MTTKRHDLMPSPGFSEDDSAPASNLSSMQRAIVTIQKLRTKVESLERTRAEPIAVVGMGCRFPGGANTPEAFYQLLDAGVDAVSEVPPERWPVERESADSEGEQRSLRWGAFLKDVDKFDASFFGISPREADSLDPQQRLLLEVTWEALERAGQLPERLMGSKTGVFIGIWSLDYQQRVIAQEQDKLDAYCFTGNVLSTAAGRLAYTLGLHGPCMSVETACSSSLTAIHLACQSLRAGESSMALAGGVNLMLSPTTTKLLSKTQALSPDGRCKTFDARANGFVRGEGCGILVLKRLSDAERDGDSILALIRGSAVNQDGRSTGLTAPNVLSQQALLKQALENARLSPQDIDYVETHGTGTSLGDPIEMEAIKAVLGAPREKNATCVLGAVKTNIGHLEAAAGIAGVIKVILAMQNDRIPGNLHFRSLNPRIDLKGSSLEIAKEAKAWMPGVRPRCAGVSSFGISGTNAHVILEEAPRSVEEALLEEEASACLLPLSAKTPDALRDMAQTFHEMLTSRQSPRLADIVHTASARRSHYLHRLSVVGKSKEEMAKQLAGYLDGDAPPGVARGQSTPGRAKVVFVFSGQGSQWLGMGRQLYESDSSFRSVVDTCDNLMTSRLGWSLLDEFDAPEGMSRVSETQVAQPLIFTLQVALVEMLRSWGISPDAMIGHSVGEIAAAHIAGILSLDEAIRLVAIRGRIMQKATGMGKMVSVSMTPEDAQSILAGYEDRVSIAAINDPNSIVLSGATSALEDVIVRSQKRGFATHPLRVDYAFHSPQMDAFERELVERLGRVDARRATLAMYSTVLSDCVEGKELDVRYWGRNVRQTVEFAGAVNAAIRDGYQLFLEIGPHPVLSGNIQQSLLAKKAEGAVNHTMRRNQDQRRTLLEAVGALYARGCAPEWSRVSPSGGKSVALPTYPWRGESHWINESVVGSPGPIRYMTRPNEPPTHPLLGGAFSLAVKPNTRIWQQTLSSVALPWVADHLVQGSAIFPGAGYVEMALAAAKSVFGDRSVALENLAFERMLPVPNEQPPFVQVTLEVDGNQGDIHVASQSADSPNWVNHARGRIKTVDNEIPSRLEPLDPLQARCTKPIPATEHYDSLEKRGLNYKKSFRRVEQLWLGDREAIAKIAEPSPEESTYRTHPCLLDACFQVAAALACLDLPSGGIVPISIHQFLWRNVAAKSIWVHARESTEQTVSGNPTFDLTIFTSSGEVIADVKGFVLRRLNDARTDSRDFLADCKFHLVWRSKPLVAGPPLDQNQGAWLILADREGVGHALAMRMRAEKMSCIIATPSHEFRRIDAGHYLVDIKNSAYFSRFLRETFHAKFPCLGAIHLLGLDAEPLEQTTNATLVRDEHHVITTAISLTQALSQLELRTSPRLVFITRGACDVTGDSGLVPAIQTSLWGLARTISIELPDLESTCIDLSESAAGDEIAKIVEELRGPDGEYQIALRGTERHVARIVAENWKAAGDSVSLPSSEPARGRPFRMVTTQPGILEKLVFFEKIREAPGADDVEVEVEAAGLNFLDVMLAMGVIPDDTGKSANDAQTDSSNLQFGFECAGRIVRIGAGVTNLEVGQEVIALGMGAMASHMVTSKHLIVAKPENMDWQRAATLPIAFLTAYYSLAHVARLCRGERVLIHAGAGGVGMAAIQWAKHVGAEIFATAGSESKRELLRSLGVHHVHDSRSLAFADEIRRITNGEGIDVVLNSLSGEFISTSFELLRDYGRFIEIGKRDYYENRALGLKPFLKNLSYTLVDLRAMMLKRPERVSLLLSEMLEFVRAGILVGLPCQAYNASRGSEAFTFMAQAKHLGKLAIVMRDPEVMLVPRRETTGTTISPESTYLITGAFGGLGLSLCKWFVDQGARHLALVGRSLPSDTARDLLNGWIDAGVSIRVLHADISRSEDTQTVFREIASMPALRGIIHTAGTLDDHTISELNGGHIERVFAPKAHGAWNLHEGTKNTPLDFFVMYSSAATSLGSPGQANYAAANAFLDALAVARRRLGLSGLSIQWGPFSSVGMAAAAAKRGHRMAYHGLESLAPEEGLVAFHRLLTQSPPVVTIMRFSVRRWLESYPHAATSPYWSELRTAGVNALPTKTSTMRFEIESAPAEARLEKMLKYVTTQLAKVIRTDASKIDSRETFTNLGIDSLMSLELRNRLEADLELKLPPTLLFSYSNPAALAKHLLQQLLPQKVEPPPVEPAKANQASAMVGQEADLPVLDDDLLAAFDASIREVKTERSS